MTLLSAHQDFVSRTLAAIGCAMERLRYIAGLRNDGGRYEHWGLVRTHGEASAQKAMKQAHQEALLEILRRPVRELFQQEKLKAEPATASAQDMNLLPAGVSSAAAAQFNSTVLALDALRRVRAKSTRRVA